MGIYDGLLRIYKNLRQRQTYANTHNLRQTYAKPTPMHKTFAKAQNLR